MKNKKFRILLIVPRYHFDKKLINEVNYRYQFPFGIAYISAVLKKEGYSVECLNLNHYSGRVEEVLNKKLAETHYDFVGTGNNALGYAITEKIISIVKIHPSKPKFILGGPILTSEPELMYSCLNPDFGVVGEGEETIIELLDFIHKNKDLKKVKGIIFRDSSGKVIFNERRPFLKNLDSIPKPDFEGVEFEKQLSNMHCNDYYFTQSQDYPRVYPILGSRGCPFQCTFCYHEGPYRKRSMKKILDEIAEGVEKYKINIVNLYDEQFSVEKKRMYQFCGGIEKIQKRTPWKINWACQMSVSSVDDKILKRIKDAGCEVVSYGFESFSPTVLKSMKKPITPELINKAFHDTLKAGMAIQAFFIFGDPAETNQSVKETLDWWRNNARGQVGIGFIQPYPGSEIYKHCLRKGIIKDKTNFIKREISNDSCLNMTESMTNQEIEKLGKDVLELTSKHTKYTVPLSMKNSGVNVFEFKVKCPHCKQIIEYKNCLIWNKFSYGFWVICRNCHLRFFIVSSIQRLAYRYYKYTRKLVDFHRRVINVIRERRI